MKKALVLSGGSIKGAFEAGAVKAILEHGYQPEMLFGISVGSLNCTFLANELARQKIENGTTDWVLAGKVLWEFWEKRITQPKDLVKSKSNLMLLLSLNWALVFKKFESILDTSPLRKLLHEIVKPEIIAQTPVQLSVGSVNLYTGDLYFAHPGQENFLEYVMASTAIPVTMPAEMIKNIPHLDGGMRDVAPLGYAINQGASELVGVCCQSEKMEPLTFNPKDLVKLISRLMDVIVNETVNNDVKQIERINQLLAAHPSVPANSPLNKYQHVDYNVIRPESEINIDMESFTHTDIVNMLNMGYAAANKALGSKRW
jgi:NTE family protein